MIRSMTQHGRSNATAVVVADDALIRQADWARGAAMVRARRGA